MELYIGVVIALGIQEPLTLRQVNKMPIFVRSDITRFKPGKIFQLAGVGTGYPAGLIIRHCPEFAGGPILLEKTILNNFKLQFSNTTNDLLISSELCK